MSQAVEFVDFVIDFHANAGRDFDWADVGQGLSEFSLAARTYGQGQKQTKFFRFCSRKMPLKLCCFYSLIDCRFRS